MNGFSNSLGVLDKLVAALNAHDIDAVVACFAEDYRNRTPAHPDRGFVGRDQVRSNWIQIFAGVPDITAAVTRATVDGSQVWSEWVMTGARADAQLFDMRGVILFEIPAQSIQSATLYLELVDMSGEGPDQGVRSVLAAPPHSKEQS
ncbi:nuclear transport factor 2 family protein [uncultured Microbacterium sp.]|nr:nuclear transport factor 2 family protein [uncultured Microbacterium sp.]